MVLRSIVTRTWHDYPSNIKLVPAGERGSGVDSIGRTSQLGDISVRSANCVFRRRRVGFATVGSVESIRKTEKRWRPAGPKAK